MHSDTCVCEVCALREEHGLSQEEALVLSQQLDAERLAHHGWVAHAITDAPLIHTHGLPEQFDHPDLEIRLAVPPKQRYALLAPLVDAVKTGRRFHAGDEDPTIFAVPVRFIACTESGRSVLRAIFPDPTGRFPDDPGCPAEWADQLRQDSD